MSKDDRSRLPPGDALTPPDTPTTAVSPTLVEAARRYAAAATAKATRTADVSDVRRFAAWCEEHGANALHYRARHGGSLEVVVDEPPKVIGQRLR